MTTSPTANDIQRILEELGQSELDDLSARLDELCGVDTPLRRTVEQLLGSDEALDHVSGIITAAAEGVVSQPDPLVGKRVGAHRVIRRLGEGGMSVVYLAERDDETFERVVCLKVMKRGLDTDALLRRFETERRILANLDHPNIARLYDGASTVDGRPYFVMEFVDGVPIDEFVEARNISLRGRLELFRRVCGAVAYAHQLLVVHRDLKPANILVTAEGVPKLLDFGIARLTGDGEGNITQAADRFLTPDCASPEQIRGEPISTASDQYSLGVLLYIILTGRRPYEVDTSDRSTMERMILEAPIKRPSRIRSVSRDLDSIVFKALRHDPPGRYGSVQDLSDDVHRYLTGLPVRARRGTLRYRAGKFLRRNTMNVIVGALLAAFAVVLGVQTLRLTTFRSRAETVARQLSEIAIVADTEISFIEAPSTPALAFGRRSFTLSAWIRMTGTTDGPVVILDKRVPPYDFPRGFEMFAYDGRLGVQLADGVTERLTQQGIILKSVGRTIYHGERELGDGEWHHVAVSVHRDTLDARRNHLSLYVDGETDGRYPWFSVRAGDISCSAPLRVGVESDGFHIARPFLGSIRLPKAFDYAMNDAEVREHYLHGLASLHTDEFHLPEMVIARADSVVIPLHVRNLSTRPVTYTWSISGLPGEDGHPPLTRFTPASGTVRLAAGPSSATVPVGVAIGRLDDPGHGRYRASVVNAETLMPVLRTGTIATPAWAAAQEIEESTEPPPLAGRAVAASGSLHPGIPLEFEVRVRPNAFITDATIAFDVTDKPNDLRMEVVALTGEVVRHVDLGTMCPGQHSVAWDGKDDGGRRVPPGHYAIDILGERLLMRWDPMAKNWTRPLVSGRLVTKVVYLP